MLKYRFDVGKALEDHGITMYVCKMEKVLSQDTFKKIKNGSTAINLSAIDRICNILNCQPGDLIEYDPEESSPSK